jgi:carboxyl-terminal processing protease
LRRRRSLTPFLLALLPVLLVCGVWLGGHPQYLPGFVRDPFVGDSQAQLYQQAVDELADNYYRKVDPNKLLDTGLTAGIKSLDDRFSHYFDPEAYKAFEESTDGALEGVGMSVAATPKLGPGLRVLETFPGSPARRAGIRRGDVITAVDGHTLAGKSSDVATALIRGRAGTAVRVTVKTGKQAPRTLSMRRARVDVPAVKAEMRTYDGMKVAHVRLAGFTSGAHEEVRQAIDRLLKRGAHGVVLDLRDNPGGLLNEAVETASIFIPEGTIVSTKGRARPRRVFEATGDPIDGKIPVVVLVNRESASASEIVTGALQDRKRAEVVGTRTFGKGVFQEIRKLSNGGALDITVGEYFTPSGRNLGGGGVKPGAGIKPDVKAVDNTKTPRDEALEVAVKTVRREAT